MVNYNQLSKQTVLLGGAKVIAPGNANGDNQGELNIAGTYGINVKKIKLTAATHGTGAEVDTAWDLPENSVVLDVFLNVTTVEATGTTKTLDIGLLSTESDGDADGFLDGAAVDVATQVTGVLVNGGVIGGAFLREDVSGATVYGKKAFITEVGTARSISVTAGSSDCADFAVELYILYLILG